MNNERGTMKIDDRAEPPPDMADDAGLDWEADAVNEIATIMSCFEPRARRRLVLYVTDRWGREG